MSVKPLVMTGITILSVLVFGCGKYESKNPTPDVTPKSEEPVNPEKNPTPSPTPIPTPTPGVEVSGGNEPGNEPSSEPPITQPEPENQVPPTPTPKPIVPEVPATPTPEPAPTPAPEPETYEDDEWLFEALKPERFTITVLNASAVLAVVDKNLELAFYNGKIDTLQNIAVKMKSEGGAYCNVVATKEFNKEEFRDGLQLSVHSISEVTTEPPTRSILLRIPEHNLAIGCIKLPLRPFKLKEVRQGLRGIFSIKLDR